jgi:quercetin dioxygenase-like cupin family protein
MIIKKLFDAPQVDVPGVANVKKRIVLGPQDGSEEIVLRYFSVGPGGMTPHHTHEFPHLVKIEAGIGAAVDGDGKEHPLQAGDYVYVNNNDVHHFSNKGTAPFEFICIVPRRGEG